MTGQGAKFEFVQAQLQSGHPGWSATKIFEQAAVQCNQRGGFARTPEKRGQHPAIREELGRHKALRESRETSGVDAHVERLTKIRKMMAGDPKLTFDNAFSE